MSEDLIVSSPTLSRAWKRLKDAEAIVDAISAACARLSAKFTHAPAAKGERALMIRRAWLRASA